MKPINHVPLVQQVVKSLVEYIKRPDVLEGSKLPSEASLCKSLNVGRGTLREAFRVLNSQGYLMLIPSRGAFVATKEPSLYQWLLMNELEVRSIVEVRQAIEPLAASLACSSASDDEISKLQSIFTKSEDLARNRNVPGLAINDEEFHLLIATMSRNSLIIGIVNDIQNYLHEFRLRTFTLENNRSNYLKYHKAIVDAISKRDETLSEQSMTQHIEAVTEDLETSKAG